MSQKFQAQIHISSLKLCICSAFVNWVSKVPKKTRIRILSENETLSDGRGNSIAFGHYYNARNDIKISHFNTHHILLPLLLV